MLFFKNYNSYDSKLDSKGFVIPRKTLVFGWNLPYLEARRINYEGQFKPVDPLP